MGVAFYAYEVDQDCTVCGKPRRECAAFLEGMADNRVTILPNPEGKRLRNNLHKRATAADAKHAGALSLFYKAADELEAAAAEHDAIAKEAERVADEYDVRKAASRASASAARTAAERLRQLTSN